MTPWDRLQQFDHDQLKRELREQDRKRWIHPERDPELAKIWVVYVWRDATWLLAGFARRPRTITMKAIRKVRRRCRVVKGESIDVRDLDHASRCGPPTEPPLRRVTTAPNIPLAVALKLPAITPRSRARTFRRKLEPATLHTKYIVIGAPGGRDRSLRYLGPLKAATKADAERKAELRWRCLYQERYVLPVSELSKRLRKALRHGRLIGGVTRLDRYFSPDPGQTTVA